MTRELREEFDRYLEEVSAREGELLPPDPFADWKLTACLQDDLRKKSFLFQDPAGRKFLCKYACEEYQAMLRAEYEVFCKNRFPFLPYIIDYRETGEEAFLLREYIEGNTLAELVGESGPLPLSEAAAILRALCRNVSCFHDMTPPIIYRDIKPSNIVLTERGDCYIVDMGTARRYREGEDSDTVCMGTVECAAPEQFGARQTDSRTDIYGLGVLFYYLLTGEMKVREKSLKKLPDKAAAVIRKCTAFDPDGRYGDIRALERALARLQPDGKLWGYRLATALSMAVSLVLLLTVGVLQIPRREVSFSSALLEQAVREELGKISGEPVYYGDLEKVTQLYICGSVVFHDESAHLQDYTPHVLSGGETGTGDISDISLLAKMPNLQYLCLDYQNIRDIAPLRRLPLVSVSLTGNPVTDLSPLSGKESLNSLNIARTGVTSLEVLEDCGGLVWLDCSWTSVDSLEPLAGLAIADLSIQGISVTDYAVLEELPVRTLICQNLPHTALPHLEQIPTLRELRLYNAGITSLEELPGLQQLSHLDLYAGSLESLEGIEDFGNLRSIVISCNPIEDCSALSVLEDVERLFLAETGCTDFSFLNEMPHLIMVNISESQRPYLEDAVPEPWFTVDT